MVHLDCFYAHFFFECVLRSFRVCFCKASLVYFPPLFIIFTNGNVFSRFAFEKIVFNSPLVAVKNMNGRGMIVMERLIALGIFTKSARARQ
ncbi:Uncharacterised protein [Candidatus Bartonella washoeensis]|uniref:Uncharacterized protein n=1 Tax=Candidatus Bartonella washoeensis Sb944nv TaxID=1094563 RepID=J0YV06_9HYPH|nr:hypothetical protein MCQ_01257 [Bartonella washoeensis Sb944nv]SPU27868.1 Uncharacterised protein [Bartonella washoeensis]